MKLKGKRIVLGVTGGIAAYKAVEVLRLLQDEGADVRVVMTRGATRFVTPLTFRAISGHPVLTSLYEGDSPRSGGDADTSGVEHIELVKDSDLVLVAPATANILAKAAWGLADDALSTILVAAESDVVWAPAMNHRMWRNAVTQDNMTRLKRLAHHVIEPEEGWMACREFGPGRMAEPATIVAHLVDLIGTPQDLAGVRVLVTAGRTEEALDPVRILTNRSTGKMGMAVAEEALARGAEVTLLAGPIDVPSPEGIKVERIVTAEEMAEAADRLFPQCDVLVMAAAVGDFRAAEPRKSKIRREEGNLELRLAANPDILAALAKRRKSSQILVGFALETAAPPESARAKLTRKGVDLLVVNDPSEPGAAIGGDTNVVTFLEPDKDSRKFPVLPKSEVARRVLDWVVKRRTVATAGGRREGTAGRAPRS